MEEQRNPSIPESTAPNSYGTGSTNPPKKHGWIVALVLGCSIAVFGLVSIFLLLGVRLSVFSDISDTVSFLGETPTTALREPTTAESAPMPTVGEHIHLKPSADGALSLQEIYIKCIPSVVSITCTWDNGIGSGTGVVLTENGYLVTNAHVVEGAKKISVLLTDGRTLDGTIVGCDTLSDLAVLHVEAEDLIPAEFGDSSQLMVGDDVVAIGDPLGVELRGTMTDGIVSAINRNISSGGRPMTLIQTNAALNSGNSGGPLINCFGQVIGINNMKIGTFSDSAGVEGLGFAIPSVTVKEIVDQLISQGYVSGRPVLPLEGEWVSYFQQQFRRLPAGLYITQTPDHPDIQAKDIIIGVDGQRVTSADDLETVLYSHQAGDQVELVVYRNGKQFTTTIILAENGKQA